MARKFGSGAATASFVGIISGGGPYDSIMISNDGAGVVEWSYDGQDVEGQALAGETVCVGPYAEEDRFEQVHVRAATGTPGGPCRVWARTS